MNEITPFVPFIVVALAYAIRVLSKVKVDFKVSVTYPGDDK